MPHFPVRHRSYGSPATIKRRGNPYFADRRADHIGSSAMKNFLAKLPPRFWMFLALIIIVFALFIYLAAWFDFFSVKKIEVRGTIIIPTMAIEGIAQDRLDNHRLFVLPERGLILYNSNALYKEIKERYPVESLRIIKRLPSSLIITITEKTPAAIWFEADTYYQVDKDGWIISTIEAPYNDLPAIYNNGLPAIDGKKINNKESLINFVTKLAPTFKDRFPSIAIKQLIIDNELTSMKLVPNKGALIYFSISDSVELQLDRLALLLQSELKSRFEKVRYIDLRFGDKVYYQ